MQKPDPTQPRNSAGEAAIEGRLEEINGHGAVTGRLWQPDGTHWICHFKEEHLEQLSDAWMRTVRIVGRSRRGKERVVEVDSLIVLDADSTSMTTELPFWKRLSLNELARRQGVSPVTDLDDISRLWPVDDDADELLRHVLEERTARRKLVNDDHVQ